MANKNQDVVYDVAVEMIKNGLTFNESCNLTAERRGLNIQTVKKHHLKDSLGLFSQQEVITAIYNGTIVELLKRRHPDDIVYIDNLFRNLYSPN